jgi:signal transduction histidine kinase
MRLRILSENGRSPGPPDTKAEPRRAATEVTGKPVAAAMRRMLGVISHELRSPLNVIQSWSHVLENELARTLTGESGRESGVDPSPATQRALAGIRCGVREQVEMIDQLLDAAQAMNGTLALELRPLPIEPLVESAIFRAQPRATEHTVTLLADYQCTDGHVEGDGERIGQALEHLLSNAIQFSPERGEVLVTVERDDGDVVISVIDQGPGVPSEARREIFEWFHRGGARRGLGLGLPLTRQLARLHGGDIEVSSEATEPGTTFTLRLPEWRPPTAHH